VAITDEDIERIAVATAALVQGDNGTEDAVTLAVIKNTMETIAPMAKENQKALLKMDDLPRRVRHLEVWIMGTNGMQVLGVIFMAFARGRGWL